MKTKKTKSDISRSNSDKSSHAFPAKNDGNKLENVTSGSDRSKGRDAAQDAEEYPGADAAETKDIQGEGFRGGKDARSSINQGSPASGSKEWANENVDKGPKTHKTRYW
jgi:hypothetical protein